MSLKVLMVDDEPGLLEQAEIFLEREDDRLQVDTTTSGEEAFRMVNEGDFDALIADYRLPDMDGVEVLKKLREGGDDIPVLVLTGRDSDDAREDCLESGADGFFLKTGNLGELYREIAERIIEVTS